MIGVAAEMVLIGGGDDDGYENRSGEAVNIFMYGQWGQVCEKTDGDGFGEQWGNGGGRDQGNGGNLGGEYGCGGGGEQRIGQGFYRDEDERAGLRFQRERKGVK